MARSTSRSRWPVEPATIELIVGIYALRLTQDGRSLSTKVALLR